MYTEIATATITTLACKETVMVNVPRVDSFCCKSPLDHSESYDNTLK